MTFCVVCLSGCISPNILVKRRTYRWGSDVREIRSNTESIDNIVEGQLADEWRALQEKGKWLVDTIGLSDKPPYIVGKLGLCT